MTALDDLAMQVIAGDGLVGRFADACLVVVSADNAQRAFAGQLLSSMKSSPAGDGRRLVRQIVGAIASADPPEVPALGAVCAVDATVVFILHGALEAVLTGSN